MVRAQILIDYEPIEPSPLAVYNLSTLFGARNPRHLDTLTDIRLPRSTNCSLNNSRVHADGLES